MNAHTGNEDEPSYIGRRPISPAAQGLSLSLSLSLSLCVCVCVCVCVSVCVCVTLSLTQTHSLSTLVREHKSQQ